MFEIWGDRAGGTRHSGSNSRNNTEMKFQDVFWGQGVCLNSKKCVQVSEERAQVINWEEDVLSDISNT